ncbi:trimethylamine monooxygenase-like [Symsagittifera roscoffensis]|uniref:trimethylamine monooxygenase-like n=1 Tax=Symsagittifera roscoffensis TaxID=84072 RepID=UPI00307B9138
MATEKVQQLNGNPEASKGVGKVRICVIGAGPSGLMTLRALQSLDVNKFEIICYERHSEIGGIWNFRAVEGLDEDGMEPHSAAYHELKVNSSKWLEECPEFPFEERVEDYPTWQNNLAYLNKFTNHFGLRDTIKFKFWVDWVQFDTENQKFAVTISDLTDDKHQKTTKIFDYVIVGNGRYNKPNYVTFTGEETFPGKILHAKYFHDPKRYAGQRVLLVGSSFSVEDFACLLTKAGAAQIDVSSRRPQMIITLPASVTKHPLPTKIEGSSVTFEDGATDCYDVIIYCTGYLDDFPFLEDSLQTVRRRKLAVELYKQVVHPKCPRLMFIGMSTILYSFSIYWVQGHLCAKLINGDFSLPGPTEMEEEIEQFVEADSKLKGLQDVINFQSERIIALGELVGKKDLDRRHIVQAWTRDRQNDILNYRENCTTAEAAAKKLRGLF